MRRFQMFLAFHRTAFGPGLSKKATHGAGYQPSRREAAREMVFCNS
jgi:hypothetical protein